VLSKMQQYPAGVWTTLGILLTLLLLGLYTRGHTRRWGSGSKAHTIPKHKVLPCVTRASWVLNSSWELDAACKRLPAGWVELVNRQAAKSALRMPVDGEQVLASANSVLIHDNRLWWLNPIAGKYTDGFTNSSVTLRSRPLEIAQTLRRLSSMHRLPDAIFQLSFGDVPTDAPNSDLPTLSIHGWVDASVPIMRYPHSERHTDIAAEKPVPWADKSRRLVYSDGHAWKSGMPSDPFRAGRTKVRQLAREHPADIYLPTKPSSTELKAIPYKNWRKHKFVLYVDGIGPSSRLQVLLQLNSTVFIPDMHIPNWPMALIKPYVHYVPVARNLSNLLAQLQWAEAHDEAARAIASRGASFIAHEMDEHHRWCAMHAAVGAVANQQRARRVNASIACGWK